MTEAGLNFLWAFAGGLGLGTWFYGGLWWTVKRLPASRHPAVWMLASFGLRAGTTLAGLYFLMAGDLKRLGLALMGILLARLGWVYGVRRGRALQP
ncbi:hypothetical protein JCM13664_00940 [Methylothermus subterraneus]